ncbi:hypothetical protein LZZ85_00225 [Terrimonas sp. NA20]|uniref:Uncharacterized protein n=1 Tax=Terrimonas ginsenosidimutans TaxID=2908004 RepID=A0ABS9KK78_9BACT|nr:hypothetical protein [Terrimonas ginsenosidimutans]MCG2612675.1 hypothetical protein [Terrimonas ginsenosidimutans]
MPRLKILLTVTTYPLPSRSYDELVCTAGVLEDGSWIRIYPIPLSFLLDLKNSGKVNSVKYTWIELEVNKREDDFRPESHSPKFYDFRDVIIHEPRVNTDGNWLLRKEYCLKNVYYNFATLIGDSKDPKNVSLATFKPASIDCFVWEEDTREWKNEWVELRKQTDLFAQGTADPQKLIPKVPYKFFYKFTDDVGKQRRLMIEDWEIGQLYWNCLRDAKKSGLVDQKTAEKIALQKVKAKYFDDFAKTKDIYLFVGTTREWHTRRALNPFVIIGVFYPMKESQGRLF